MSDTNLVWEEPQGTHAYHRGLIQRMADELRANPDRWGCVQHVPKGKQAHRQKFFAKMEGFEAISRRQADGSTKCYARYVGVPHPAADQFD